MLRVPLQSGRSPNDTTDSLGDVGVGVMDQRRGDLRRLCDRLDANLGVGTLELINGFPEPLFRLLTASGGG
jgi:hypothetical protein